MNRKQKIIVSVVGISIVLLTLLGLTYAYFLTRIQGNTNEKSISVSTANLVLEYGENTNIIQEINNAEPGYSVEKIFTATNKGNSSVTYGAALVDIVNELSRQGDLVYTLTCTSYLTESFTLASNGTLTGTVDGTCNGVTAEKQFPSTSTLSIMTTNTIDTTHTQAYKLTITYKEMGVDQSEDMGKTFSAKVNIVDLAKLIVDNPYKNDTGTLKKTIIDNAMLGLNGTTYGSEVTEFTSVSGANDRLLNNAPDDYGTSYYYYGAVTDNYVSFADKLWRIVRINGDGTIRLVLDDVAKDTSGSVIKTAFNESYNDNAYVGYMYGTPGSTTYDDTHKNINDSTIKTKVDAWYKTNIVDMGFNDYVADTLFCNDKTLASNGIAGITLQLGYGNKITSYSTTERLRYSEGEIDITASKPTFKCAENATNDYSRFTVNITTLPNGNKTNGNLTYPVGLLTADEVAYAGTYKIGISNKTYYLYNSSISTIYWLSAPSASGSYSLSWFVNAPNGNLNSYNVSRSSSFRPSINLKTNILLTNGNGTKENPYIIE